MLVVADVLVVNAALLAVLALRFQYRPTLATLGQAPGYFILLTVLWAMWASFFDCYDLPVTADAGQSAWAGGRAATMAALTYLLIPWLSPPFHVSRLSALVFVVAVGASVPAWRALYAAVFHQPTFLQHLLIVGAGRSGAELARELGCEPEHGNPYSGSGYKVVGFVDDDPLKAGAVIEGVPVLGNREDLVRLVEELEVDTVVMAIAHTPQIHAELFQALLDCREKSVRLELMTSVYERLTGKVPVEHAERDLRVIVSLSDEPTDRLFRAGKYLVDRLAGLVGLVALVPMACAVGLANALWAPGPLLYRQARIGERGRRFNVVKFRTMVPDAERDCGAVWAQTGDRRITRVGRVLRRTRLDELPQVWNMLKGEMSLIGPRPERPELVATLVNLVPFYQARHAVRPGITGWAQVRYCYGASVHDSLIKLQYDLYYIKHQSLYLDLSIMVKTVRVMLGMQGR